MPDVMQAQSHHHYGVSKADLRKSNKPIMEKKRRARINQCLDELKSLILEAMKKDPARHAKLEKADILEMTVKHLQDLQQREMRTAVAADPTVVTKFHSGFNECATEVSRYVSSIEGVDEGVKRRLVGHLTGCLSGLNQVLPLAAAAGPPRDEDVNNNTGSRLQALVGLHLLPRLGGSPSLAAEHRSAFRAVLQRSSPPVSPLSSDPESGPELGGPPPPDSEKQPPLNLAVRRTEDLIENPAPQPSTSSGTSSSTTVDMWRPW